MLRQGNVRTSSFPVCEGNFELLRGLAKYFNSENFCQIKGNAKGLSTRNIVILICTQLEYMFC